MFKLVVNPGTAAAWEVPLAEGVHTLGRGSDNTIPLDHESVSERHAELVVRKSEVWLRDLGSSAGSWLGDDPVDETVLLPGTRVRLGQVELELVEAPAAEALTPDAPAVITASRSCQLHPRIQALWWCPRCGRFFCALCVTTQPERGADRPCCRSCGVACRPVVPEEPADARGFLKLAVEAFVYPLRGHGPWVLGAGTLFFVVLEGVARLAEFPLLGLVLLILLGVFTTGYLFQYVKEIVHTTAVGRDELPDWPDLDDWMEDMLRPFAQMLVLGVVCFGPALVAEVWMPAGLEERLGTAGVAGVVWGLRILGMLVFPMAMLGLAMADGLAGLNPVLLLGSILRIPGPYLVAAGLFEAVMFLYWKAPDGLEKWLPVPVLSWIAGYLAGFYLLAVAARILGLLYRTQRDRLGWESGAKR